MGTQKRDNQLLRWTFILTMGYYFAFELNRYVWCLWCLALCSPAGVLRFECFGFLMRVLHDVIHVAFHHKIFSNSQARTPVQLDALPLLYRLFIIIIIVVCIVSGENENQKSIHPLYKDDFGHHIFAE